jgi:hypothetical protein
MLASLIHGHRYRLPRREAANAAAAGIELGTGREAADAFE